MDAKCCFLAGLMLAAVSACSDDTAKRDSLDPNLDLSVDLGSDAVNDVGPAPRETTLPVLHPYESARAQRGQEFLLNGGIVRPNIPMQAVRNLWLVWGGGRPADDAELWDRFNSRYGTVSAEDGAIPLGVEISGSNAALTCLTCHVDRVAGEVVIGTGNSMLDLQTLYEDLVRLQELAEANGIPTPPVPSQLEVRTGAVGANDAFGLGMGLSTTLGFGGDINVEYGFQQAPTWWTVRHRNRVYTDGSGQTRGYRTMMATLLAYGVTYSELQQLDEEFEDIHHYILSLEPPEWPFSPPPSDGVMRGQTVFRDHCSRCHGVYEGADAGYPDYIEPIGMVATDPVRAQSFTETEAAWVNASWLGDIPMESTGGYLAPPLVGIWATAPYLHNGSVPDLRGILDSTARPAVWRREGRELEDYDASAVGWKYTVESAPTNGDSRAGRAVFDTSRRGLSNSGHTYGDVLSEADRNDLLEYLKTL